MKTATKQATRTPGGVVPSTEVASSCQEHASSVVVRRVQPFSHYAAGCRSAGSVPLERIPAELQALEMLLRNLYAPRQMRAFWHGKQTTLAEIVSSAVGAHDKAETNKQTNRTLTTDMKKHIESAATAFALILTALVCIVQELMKGGASTAKEDAAPAKDKPKDKPNTKEEEPPEDAGDDDMLGGDNEPEPEVTIEQLRAAGQAALKAGKSDKMKAVLKKYGAANLGGLDKDNYADVLTALKKLA